MQRFHFALIITSLLLTHSLFAHDFSEAEKYFANRENNLQAIADARAEFKKGLSSSKRRDVYYAVDRLARLAFYEGEVLTPLSDKARRVAIFADCVDSVSTVHPSKYGENAVYYHWHAACLSLWGKSANQMQALQRLQEITDTINVGLKKYPRYDQGGVFRIAAGMYYQSKMLVLLGLYDPEKALGYINQAIQMGPDHFMSYVYKAEILRELDREEEGRQMIQEPLSRLKKAMNDGSIPAYLLVEAKHFYNKMLEF